MLETIPVILTFCPEIATGKYLFNATPIEIFKQNQKRSIVIRIHFDFHRISYQHVDIT